MTDDNCNSHLISCPAQLTLSNPKYLNTVNENIDVNINVNTAVVNL